MLPRNENRYTEKKKKKERNNPNAALFLLIRFARKEALWLFPLASADLTEGACGVGGEGELSWCVYSLGLPQQSTTDRVA